MQSFTPLIVAHRGARAHAPENTLAAARLGYAEHAHMWELDTGFTKDGYLVVVHDDTLTRTTDVSMRPEFAARAPWKLEDFTLEELQTLDAGSWFVDKDPFKTIALGEVSPETAASYRGEKIPTLEEALLLTKELDWKVNVEIKDHSQRSGHERITAAVIDVITQLDMAERVLLSSFQHVYLLEAELLLPQMARGALVEGDKPEDAVSVCQKAKAALYHPQHTLLAAEDMGKLQRAGIGANVWTVNKVPDMQRCINMGVNAIITDYPKRLRELLATQPPSSTAEYI